MLAWKDIRDLILAAGGLYLAIYEVQFSPPPVDFPTLVLAAGMMGLPGVFRAEEK